MVCAEASSQVMLKPSFISLDKIRICFSVGSSHLQFVVFSVCIILGYLDDCKLIDTGGSDLIGLKDQALN